jgi:hypothetical protein
MGAPRSYTPPIPVEQSSNLKTSSGFFFVIRGCCLNDRIDSTQSRNESDEWVYTSEAENWSISFRSMPRSVLCIAKVCTLHEQYLEKYR